ncbi:hypothetical protein BYT27DRAFT_7216929 [Phlegmacium glaucopus]|nr:hypothetical protein BYT27DRAFT_7216929 [Phlegmacium glaucopus]
MAPPVGRLLGNCRCLQRFLKVYKDLQRFLKVYKVHKGAMPLRGMNDADQSDISVRAVDVFLNFKSEDASNEDDDGSIMSGSISSCGACDVFSSSEFDDDDVTAAEATAAAALNLETIAGPFTQQHFVNIPSNWINATGDDDADISSEGSDEN